MEPNLDSAESILMAAGYELVAPLNEPFSATISSMSHSGTVFPNLKSKLTMEQLQRMRNHVPLGHLLGIEELAFSGQLVHQLLMRVIKSSITNDSFSVLVVDKVIQFSSQDFCLITGLRFGELPVLEDSHINSRLKAAYFPNSRTVTLSELERAFMACTDEEDTYKLGLVYIAECILLGREMHGLVDLRYLGLVDEEEKWTEFPWGSVSFERTLTSLTNAALQRYKAFKQGKNNRDKYTLRGFPFAFQIWAYESIPRLVSVNFARRLQCAEPPRILHWGSVVVPSFVKLRKYIFLRKKIKLLKITPTDKEKGQDYWKDWYKSVGVPPIEGIPEGVTQVGNLDVADTSISLKMTVESLKSELAAYKSFMVGEIQKLSNGLLIERNKSIKVEKELMAVKKVLAIVKEELRLVKGTVGSAFIHESDRDVENRRTNMVNELIISESHVKSGGQQKRQPLEAISLETLGFDVSKTPNQSGPMFSEPQTNLVVEQHIQGNDEEAVTVAEDGSVRQTHAKPIEEDAVPTKVIEQPGKESGKDEAKKVIVSQYFAGANMVESGSGLEVAGGHSLVLQEGPPSVQPSFKIALPDAVPWSLQDVIYSHIHACLTKDNVQAVSQNAEPVSDTDEVQFLSPSSVGRRGLRKKRKGSEIMPHFTAVNTTKRKRSFQPQIQDNPSSKFDPMGLIPRVDMLELIKFVENWSSNPSEQVDLGLITVDRAFFVELIQRSHFLRDTHIDFGFHLIRQRQQGYPDYFGLHWTTADFFFSGFLQKNYDVFKDLKDISKWEPSNELIQYVNGELPDNSLPWASVHFVYIPWNVKNNHWVLVLLDLEARTITVYDSATDSRGLRHILTNLQELSILLPHLLVRAGFYTGPAAFKCAKNLQTMPFPIKCAQGAPQQENGGDCGVFVLKYLEYLTSGFPIQACVQENMNHFRLKLAVEFMRGKAYMTI